MKTNVRHIAHISLTLLTGLALCCSAATACQNDAQQDSPQSEAATSETTKQEKKPTKEPIYDEEADGAALIDAALAKAQKENQQVLIQWGGNWCGWCYKLHDIMKADREIASTLRNEYQVVLIDVGSFDRNTKLLEKYKADIKKHGLPFLTVLDSSGEVVVNQETTPLESKEEGKAEHDRTAVLDFLTEHVAQPRVASEVLEAAMKEGVDSKRLVFLHFGAPWCGWCHYLEDWMEEDQQKILHEQFVDVKVDTDRMTGGQELLESFRDEPSGIPWFAFIDPQTKKVIVSSTGPEGNVGFPSTDDEIAHFAAMLAKCGDRFSSDEIEGLKRSLVENRTKREAARAKQQRKVIIQPEAKESADENK